MRRSTRLWSRATGTTAIVSVLMGLAIPWGAASDSAVPWTSFSESTTCGRPYVATPIMSRTGSLPEEERILGPIGRYLGRTVGEVRRQLVDWVVPMSGGRRVQVHRAALPAFEQVTANLAVAAARGNWYQISSAAAFVPRTIGGSHQLSRHALGISIDLNPARNPYSSDPAVLITDMPAWYVQAWRDAGFCWGGDWAFSKDPMHFSWMGPAPGTPGLPVLAPHGTPMPYAAADSFISGWGGLTATGSMAVADMSGSGAADLVRLRDHPRGLVVETLSARSGFGRCSMSRWMVEGLAVEDGVLAFGDVDGDSRIELVSVSPEGQLVVASRDSEVPVSRVIPVPAGLRSVVVADWVGDRRGDLHLVGEGGAMMVLAGPEFTTVLYAGTLPTVPTWLLAGDRDGDGTVELFAVDGSGLVSVLKRGPDGVLAVVETASIDVQGAVAVAATDLDGDSRADLAVLTGDGRLRVWLGNSATGRPTSGWWVNPGYECPDHPIPLEYSGVFYDDDHTGYEYAIERLAATGVTSGCNPPFGDAYCPNRPVSRAEMATFLARALALPSTSENPFTDDDGSIHEGDIGRIATAGITQGCGVGLYCPHAAVTRGEMAAFLVRAGSLPAAGGVAPFVDADGHPFSAEIATLAAAGVTAGCEEGFFCPDAAVTRVEMAVFLVRLLDG